MKRKQFTTFTLADIDKKGKIRQPLNPMELTDSRVHEHAPLANNGDGLSDEMVKLLHTNPFMFNQDKSSQIIASIEDFYITTRKIDIQLGSLIRGNEYSKAKKQKIIKHAFKQWKNDFELNKKQVLSLTADQIFVVGDVTTPMIKLKHYLLLILIFFILAFFMYRPGQVWDEPWVRNISEALTNAFTVPWAKIVANVGLYIVIIAIFSSFMYNEIIKNFNKLSQDAPVLYERAKAQIEKDFTEKYKYTRKYYLRAVSRYTPTIPTLDISRTAVGNTDFEDVQLMTNTYIRKTANLKRRKLIMKISNILTIYLPLIFGIVIGGYVIYTIILSFF